MRSLQSRIESGKFGAAIRWAKAPPRNTRFWTNVQVGKPDDCWEWRLSRHRFGYGKVKYFGKFTSAHRVAFLLTFGPIPKDKQVCHNCDNPPCCNPAHLFLGTASENCRDSILKGRKKGPRRLAGYTKMTPCLVIQIRAEIQSGKTQTQVASELNTRQDYISKIISGKRWANVVQK